jgi:hypothetical protein
MVREGDCAHDLFMQRLHYMGESVVVADAVCGALFDYASALAGRGMADVVTLPILDEASIQTVAKMLIGPASQLYATPLQSHDEVGSDPAVIAELQRRTAALQSRF